MRVKNAIVALIVLFIAATLNAQDFQGVATYKTQTKLDIKLDSTQMGSDMQKKMMAMLKKQFEKTYKLTFNKEESVYKEEDKLEDPNPQGMVMVMVNTGGSDVLYKNTKENRYTSQNESFSKIFLIQDRLKTVDWVLGRETKNIGDYTCYKATFKREVEVRENGISINNDKEFNEEVEKKEIEVLAWYTPQIPVNNGPENYHGLPGLILEVSDGTQTIVCSRIVINPENKVKISEPKKGKLVSQEKFDEIMNKKMKEMEEQNNSSHRGRDGETIEIRIGG